MSKHYAMDVPRGVAIVEPAEHAGAVIYDVRLDCGGVEPTVTYETDRGEVALHAHSRVEVEDTPLRELRLAFARAVLAGPDR